MKYDLIVVGAGLSGLATAYFWCTRVSEQAKILIIESSTRIGGSSVCHRCDVGGRKMVAPGGAQELVFPSTYSTIAKATLAEIGVDFSDLETCIDNNHYADRGAGGHAFCFSSDIWGREGVAIWSPHDALGLSDAPLCDEAKGEIEKILSGSVDWFEGLDEQAKLEVLQSRSCAEVLSEFGKCHEETQRFFAFSTSPSSGMPFATHPALDAALVGYPPFGALAPNIPGPWPGLTRAGRQFFGTTSPVTYRFPDGNATIARAFLAWLRPDAFRGVNVAERLGEQVNVEKLCDPASLRSFRLNERVDRVSSVDHTNVVVDATNENGRQVRYSAKAAVIATWASAAPSIVPSLSPEQKTTASAICRFPIVSATLSISNWRAWQNLGVSSLSWPGHPTWQRAELGFPVSLGGFSPSKTPDEPNVITVLGAATAEHYEPCVAAKTGRTLLEQSKSKDQLTIDLVRLISRALQPHGFDPRSELHEVDVELWPNGYSRYSTSLDYRDKDAASADDKDELANGVGQITIAGADVVDHPFLDGAIEAAARAVSLQICRKGLGKRAVSLV